MNELPAGTVTMLFTDIEGSTRLLHALGDRYLDVLAEHHRLLRTAFDEHSGTEVSTEGDAFFAVFTRATDAVAAAVTGQRALTSYPWPDGSTVKVRMGLHTGEPVVHSNDYVGYDVHRAARICASGHGGQIVVSDATRGLVEGAMDGIGLVDLGEHRLKDLSRAEHLHQVAAEGIPSEFPPLRSLGSVRNNLPVQLTSFVGRERELRRLRQLVTEHRLVTLTGPGGAGKTRLAIEAAHTLLAQFPDGVWLVELSVLTDHQFVAQTVASTIGLRDMSGRPPVEAIIEYSNGKRLLLLLDNFEHVIAAAGDVDRLVQTCPGISILVTSREALRLQGEWELAVPPLRRPEPSGITDLAQLSEVESVQLFVERARAVMPSFGVTADNAAAMVDIARRLDGLPLAIELAAARAKVLSPEALAARLDNRLGLLTGGPRNLPERQRTLRATIEWSYGLLEHQEKQLLARMSVFYGPVELETVESVCGDDGMDVLTALEGLVDKSLVRRADRGPEGVLFWTLETVKEFARDVLRQQGDDLHTRSRHAQHYQRLAEQARAEILGERQLYWLARLEREQDNVSAAIRHSLEQGDVDRAASITAGVHHYWFIRGHYATGLYWVRQVLKRDISDPLLRARVLVANARFAADQGFHEEAEHSLTEAAETARLHNHDLLLAHTRSELATLRMRRGEAGMVELTEQALVVFRREGDVAAEAVGLMRLGLDITRRGDYDSARGVFGRAAELMRGIKNSWGTAAALNNIGYVLALENRFDEAQPYLEEALGLLHQVGTKDGIATATDTMALIARGYGDEERAIALYEEALGLFQEMGYLQGSAFVQVHLGRIRLERGEHELAAISLQEALEVAQRLADEEVQGFAFEGIAALSLQTGRAETAAMMFGAAERFRSKVGLPLAPVDRIRLERDAAQLVKELGPDAAQEAQERGKHMTPDELKAAALATVEAMTHST